MKKINLESYDLSEETVKRISGLTLRRRIILINMVVFIIYTLISSFIEMPKILRWIILATLTILLITSLVSYYIHYKNLIKYLEKESDIND